MHKPTLCPVTVWVAPLSGTTSQTTGVSLVTATGSPELAKGAMVRVGKSSGRSAIASKVITCVASTTLKERGTASAAG